MTISQPPYHQTNSRELSCCVLVQVQSNLEFDEFDDWKFGLLNLEFSMNERHFTRKEIKGSLVY
jgi:hypothetical protein